MACFRSAEAKTIQDGVKLGVNTAPAVAMQGLLDLFGCRRRIGKEDGGRSEAGRLGRTRRGRRIGAVIIQSRSELLTQFACDDFGLLRPLAVLDGDIQRVPIPRCDRLLLYDFSGMDRKRASGDEQRTELGSIEEGSACVH